MPRFASYNYLSSSRFITFCINALPSTTLQLNYYIIRSFPSRRFFSPGDLSHSLYANPHTLTSRTTPTSLREEGAREILIPIPGTATDPPCVASHHITALLSRACTTYPRRISKPQQHIRLRSPNRSCATPPTGPRRRLYPISMFPSSSQRAFSEVRSACVVQEKILDIFFPLLDMSHHMYRLWFAPRRGVRYLSTQNEKINSLETVRTPTSYIQLALSNAQILKLFLKPVASSSPTAAQQMFRPK